jgi:hypothetical protein
MANTVTVTMSTLIDRALEELQGPAELGKRVVLSTTMTTSTTSILLSDSNLGVGDVVELGSELVMVTNIASAPTYTVARGYYGTTAATHAINDVGSVNPQWNRKRVAGAVRRAFPRLEALGVPLIKTTTAFPVETLDNANRWVLEIPAETRDVWNVRVDLTEVTHWEFVEDVTGYSTGKVVRLPVWVDEDAQHTVVYRAPYRWSTYPSDPVEASTIVVPEGAEDLPAAYAVAWLVAAREISRSEIDRAQEWATGEPQRGGVSAAVERARWQSFYRQLDEVRRMDPPLPRRPYVRRRRGSM